MRFKTLTLLAALAATLAIPAQAQTEIQWWHSMTAVNGEWVNDLAKQFNESQKEFRVVPTYKGSYDESMTAAIAAFRAGNAPHILQVFEVGTATMMASKGVDRSGGPGHEGRRRRSSTRTPTSRRWPATTPRPTARC